MEKKIKFTDNPSFAKTVYGVVIAVLCITAIVIGIVAANQRQDDPLPGGDGTVNEGDGSGNTGEGENNGEGGNTTPDEPKKLSFISPVSGKVITKHDLTVPVFSVTLEEWRVHSGIDVSCAEGAAVFAAEDGVVTKVYNDPMLGATVEIKHDGDITTVYSNLAADEDYVKVGDTVVRGGKIGTVGDTSVSELAEEPHLHFAVKKAGAAVDPLSVISEESKEASLGITK
jgi:murein DD-endopeptidase MepM/ murein hydrolase activator NlpD